MSESIKDYLSNVYLGSRNLSSGLVYIKTIEYAIQLDWTKGIDNVYKQVRKLRDAKHLSVTNQAILQNLLSLLSDAISTSYIDGVNISNENLGIVTHTSPSGVVLHHAYFNNNPELSLSAPTFEQLKSIGVATKAAKTTKELYN